MNTTVLEKARELAAALSTSTEFIKMRACEDAAAQDEGLVSLYAQYSEKRQQVEEITMNASPDYEQMGALSRELDEIQETIHAMPLAIAMRSAREDFSAMMQQVNAELSRVLSPEDEGCSGDCGGCGGGCGCGHQH